MSDRMKRVDAKCRRLPASYVSRVPGGVMEKVTNALLAGEWKPPELLRARQFEQLRGLLGFAERYSPFHARRMREAGFDPSQMQSLDDLRALPPMTRGGLQGGFDEITCRTLPRGERFISEKATSGTSGVPVRVRMTNAYGVVWSAITLRNHVWSGIEGGWNVAGIRHLHAKNGGARDKPEGAAQSSWGGAIGQSFKTGPACAMHIGWAVEKQAAFLRKHDPHLLVSGSWNLTLLGDYLQEQGMRLPSLHALHGMGEVVTDEMRARMESAFDAPFFDTYSCNEMGYISSTCPEGHGYHVHDETVVLEIVDEQGAPCAPGETGRVLVTGLTNFGFPLIRYELGDDAVAGPTEPCPCGRGLSRMGPIIGRTWRHFVATDGQRLSTHPASALIRAAGHLRQYRVVQHTREQIEVMIVPDEGFGQEQQQTISSGLRDHLGQDMQVTFSLVDEIPLAPSGKHTAFICDAT
jgi:phenylacetate-coenzyme A ligase PaaK-like adenylate-forming protein